MNKKIIGITCGGIIFGIILLLVFVLGMKQLSAIGSTGEETISKEEYYEMESQNDSSTENEIWEESQNPEEIKPQEMTEQGELTAESIQNAEYPYYVKVNRMANCVTVYGLDEQGNYSIPVKAMVCSVGLNDNTPLGVFHTSTKYSWRYLYGDVYGQYAYRIKGPIMFHSVPYYEKDKSTLKAEEYNKLGKAASMGCVRLSVQDAKWLIDNCPEGTTVEIYDSEDPGPLGKPTPIEIDTSSANKGWDPTDPDIANPWNGSAPVISGVSDITLEKGSQFDLYDGISASDYLGNILEVIAEGNVDTGVLGDYFIIYSAIDQAGRETKEKAVIKVVDTTKPILKIEGEFCVNDSNKNKLMETLYANTIVMDNGEYLDADKVSFNTVLLNAALESYTYGSYQCSAVVVDDAGNQSEKIFFDVVYEDKTLPEIIVSQRNLKVPILRGESTEEQQITLAETAAIEMVSNNISIIESSYYTHALQVASIEKEYKESVTSSGKKQNLLKTIRVNVKVIAMDEYQNRAEALIPVLVEIQDY